MAFLMCTHSKFYLDEQEHEEITLHSHEEVTVQSHYEEVTVQDAPPMTTRRRLFAAPAMDAVILQNKGHRAFQTRQDAEPLEAIEVQHPSSI